MGLLGPPADSAAAETKAAASAAPASSESRSRESSGPPRYNGFRTNTVTDDRQSRRPDAAVHLFRPPALGQEVFAWGVCVRSHHQGLFEFGQIISTRSSCCPTNT